jgi:hypothetical protein
MKKTKKTLLLLKLLSQGVVDTKRGHITNQEVLFKRIEKKLKKVLSLIVMTSS